MNAKADAAGGNAGSAADAGSPSSGAGNAGNAGSLSSGAGNGGSLSNGSGNGGSPALVLGGAAGSVETAAVALCLNPDQVPDNWGPAAGAPACAAGQLGEFLFEGCRYELLKAAAYDVDMFSGGHSPCCYLSQLIECP